MASLDELYTSITSESTSDVNSVQISNENKMSVVLDYYTNNFRTSIEQIHRQIIDDIYSTNENEEKRTTERTAALQILEDAKSLPLDKYTSLFCDLYDNHNLQKKYVQLIMSVTEKYGNDYISAMNLWVTEIRKNFGLIGNFFLTCCMKLVLGYFRIKLFCKFWLWNPDILKKFKLW